MKQLTTMSLKTPFDLSSVSFFSFTDRSLLKVIAVELNTESTLSETDSTSSQ